MSFQKDLLSGVVYTLLLVLAGACGRTPSERSARYLKAGRDLVGKKDYIRAILQFKNAVQAMPGDAEPYYQMGLAYWRSGDVPAAVRALYTATELNPKHEKAQLQLAEILTATESKDLVEEATRRLRGLLSASPSNQEAITALANAEIRLGKNEDASRRLEEALERFPSNLQASVALVRLKLATNDTAGAEIILKRVVASSTQSPEAALALGEFYLFAQQLDKAEIELQRALTINPRYGPALINLGELQVAGKRMEEAEQTYQRLAALPDKTYRPLHAIFLYQAGKKEAGLMEMEEFVKAEPANRVTRSQLVTMYLETNQIARAQNLLDDALKRNSKDADALVERGELLLKLGRPVDAERDLTRFLSATPDSAEAHFALSEVRKAQGMLRLERAELAEALRFNPAFLPARLALADSKFSSRDGKSALEVLEEAPAVQKRLLQWIIERNWALLTLSDVRTLRPTLDQLLKVGRLPELVLQDAVARMIEKDYSGARAAAEEVLRSQPEEPRAVRVIADAYLAQNRPQQAVQRAAEIAAAHPKSAPLQLALGQIQVRAGDYAEARKAFEASAAVDPTNIPSGLALAELDRRESRFEAAGSRLSRLFTAHPKNVQVILLLAKVEDGAKNRANAVAKYREVLLLDTDNVDALNNMAWDLALDNSDEALKFAEQALEVAPGNPAVQDTLGFVYYRRGIYAKAVEYLKAAVQKEPTPNHQFHLAMSYLKSGDQLQGEKLLRMALQQDPNLRRTEMGW
jgi:tetratricopeptide (TPR) repeat protein